MTFDTNSWLIIGGILVALVILIAILARRSRPRVDQRPRQEGYVASTERPYMKSGEAPTAVAPPTARVDGPQGNGIADEMATATTDVAGDIIGIQARSHLPGATATPDDLQILKGVGPKFATRLNELGIVRYEQLANLSENEAAMLDEKLGPFRGRIARDRVIDQARYLARGDVDGFEEQFGKLGGGR